MINAKVWLEFGLRDIGRAERLAKVGDYDGAAYHLQQAVEKLLKSLLVHLRIELSSREFRTHNIGFLIDVLGKEITTPEWLEEARILTPYAFTTRYPDDYIPVSLEEYEEAYEIALKVYEWAKGIINAEQP